MVMPHLHTAPGAHDLTVSAYVFMQDGAEVRLWLHWHKKLQQWLQFGGHVEQHEHPWAAIIHELHEESGYQADQLRILQPATFLKPLTGAVLHPADVCTNTHHFPDLDHFHTDIAYAFTTDQQPRNKPVDGESTRLHAFTRSELLALQASEIPESSREIALFIFDQLLPSWVATDCSNFFITSI